MSQVGVSGSLSVAEYRANGLRPLRSRTLDSQSLLGSSHIRLDMDTVLSQ